MTRKEAAERVIKLFETGYYIEAEWNTLDGKKRLMAGNTGYKWLVTYTRNEKGCYTASDVEVFDPYTHFAETVYDAYGRPLLLVPGSEKK